MKSIIIAVLITASAMLFTTSARADHTNTSTNAITCNFSNLVAAVEGLELSDIKAPNDHARRGRLNSLENAVENAMEAAEHGDADEVLDALHHIAKKSNGRKNAWITGDAADDLNEALDELLDCLDAYVHDDGE